MTVSWLFQDLRAAKKTGTAVFEQDQRVKKVYFNRGDILFASSNNNDERLGEFLLQQSRITQAQFDAASETVRKTGKKLGAVLFELGLLSPQDLIVQVKLQVKRIIIELFTWRTGAYRFEEGNPTASEIIPLQISTGNLILEGTVGLDWQVIRKRLPPLKTILRPSSDPSLIFQGADLSADQQTVLSMIDGSRNLEQLCAVTGIGDFNTLKAVYLLLALKLAEIGEIKSEKEKNFVRDALSEAAKAAQKPEKAPEPAVTRDAIEQAFEAMKRQDDFQILGVNAMTPESELKHAYFRLAKRYHPDRHFEPDMADLKDKLEALFGRIHDAYQRISDPEQRRQYEKKSAQKPTAQYEEKRAADYVENYAEKTKSAAAYFNAGMSEFKIGNFWGAAEQFAWAVRLDPVRGSYLYYYGMSLMQMPRRRHEAEENLQKAIEIDPLKVEYRLELGGMYLKSGLKAKALEVYLSGLRALPDSDQLKEAITAAGGQIPPTEQQSSPGLFKKMFKDNKE